MSSFRSCRGRLTALFALSAWALILTSNSLAAPTELEAGDVSVIGYQSKAQSFEIPPPPDGPDSNANPDLSLNERAYTFVTWVDLGVGTQIGFTDFGYRGAGSWYTKSSDESATVWTATETVEAGTVVRLTFAESNFEGVSIAEATTGSVEGMFNTLSLLPEISGTIFNEGDQVFAFQGQFSVSGDTGTLAGKTIFGLNTDFQGDPSWIPLDEDKYPDTSIVRRKSKLPSELAEAGAHIEIIDASGTDPIIRANAQYDGTREGMTIAGYKNAIQRVNADGEELGTWEFSPQDQSIDWLDDTSFEIVAEIPEPAVAIGALILTAGFLLPFRLRDRRGQG